MNRWGVATASTSCCFLHLLVLFPAIFLIGYFMRDLQLVVQDVCLDRVDVPVHHLLISHLRQRVVSLEIDHLLFNLIQLLRLLLKLCLKCSQFRHVVVVHVGVGAVLLLGLVHLNTSTLSLSAFSGSGLLE